MLRKQKYRRSKVFWGHIIFKYSHVHNTDYLKKNKIKEYYVMFIQLNISSQYFVLLKRDQSYLILLSFLEFSNASSIFRICLYFLNKGERYYLHKAYGNVPQVTQREQSLLLIKYQSSFWLMLACHIFSSINLIKLTKKGRIHKTSQIRLSSPL